MTKKSVKYKRRLKTKNRNYLSKKPRKISSVRKKLSKKSFNKKKSKKRKVRFRKGGASLQEITPEEINTACDKLDIKEKEGKLEKLEEDYLKEDPGGDKYNAKADQTIIQMWDQVKEKYKLDRLKIGFVIWYIMKNRPGRR